MKTVINWLIIGIALTILAVVAISCQAASPTPRDTAERADNITTALTGATNEVQRAEAVTQKGLADYPDLGNDYWGPISTHHQLAIVHLIELARQRDKMRGDAAYIAQLEAENQRLASDLVKESFRLWMLLSMGAAIVAAIASTVGIFGGAIKGGAMLGSAFGLLSLFAASMAFAGGAIMQFLGIAVWIGAALLSAFAVIAVVVAVKHVIHRFKATSREAVLKLASEGDIAGAKAAAYAAAGSKEKGKQAAKLVESDTIITATLQE
jgi:hypothetical protein